jgi:hypothetical protein
MRQLLRLVSLVAFVISVPSAVFGQISAAGGGIIWGVVRDSSGEGLAGVTVVAESPALIRHREAVTESSGRFSLRDLPPGTYTVTFTGPGLVTVLRENIEMTGTGTRDVSQDMHNGSPSETVTVTTEPPGVDVRSTAHQFVISGLMLDSFPLPRFPNALAAAAAPGVVCTTRDVGAVAFDFLAPCVAHGGRSSDQRITIGGMNVGAIHMPEFSNFIPNAEAAQEIVIETAASSAEWQTGGPKINFIPRNGGNILKGALFMTAAFGRMQSRNLTPDLVDQGMTASDTLDKTWDVNPFVGGPIVRGKLWFSASFRTQGAQVLTDQRYNLNAFQPDNWVYAPGSQARSRDGRWTDYYGRLTFQLNKSNRIAALFSDQDKCECIAGVSATRTPEAGFNDRNWLQRTLQFEWSSPLSNRFMVEVVGQKRDIGQGFTELTQVTSGVSAHLLENYESLIGATVINGGGVLPNTFSFHGPGPVPEGQGSTAGGPFNKTRRPSYAYHASMTYVTGAHTIKIGVQDTFGYYSAERYMTTRDPSGRQVRYTFATPGKPQAVTLYTPSFMRNELDHDMGIYAQGRLTLSRLTLNYGSRFDWFKSSYQAQTIPATAYGRPEATFEPGRNLDWKDFSPRFGLAYDLAGSGRTALKFTVNKFMQSQGLSGVGASGNPLANGRGLTNSFTRGWSDIDQDYFVDCDLYRRDANGECTNGISPTVLNTVPTVLTDAATRFGWGLRPYNWELSAGVQHELWPGVTLDVSYFRRWYGNFLATDDTACVNAIERTGCREPGNYQSYDIVTPVDSRLPGGGGYILRGFVDSTSAEMASLAPVNQIVRVEDIGARQIERWNGFDFSLQLRREGLFLLGSASTGRRYANQCEVWPLVPEVQGSGRPRSACEVSEPFRTWFKGLAAYRLPRFDTLPGWMATLAADLQLAAVVQSIPGNELSANYPMTNAEFLRPCPSEELSGATQCSTLGRFLANATRSTDTRNVTLMLPATRYDERHHQMDVRIGKALRFGRSTMEMNLDVFNVFNENPVLSRNNTLTWHTDPGTYAAAQQQQADGLYHSLWSPTSVVMPRLAKFSVTFGF